MKISENTNIGLPIKNLIAIIFFICTGLYAFFTIQERLNKLETADHLKEQFDAFQKKMNGH